MLKRKTDAYISWLRSCRGRLKAPFSIATTPRCRRKALHISLDCSTYL